MRLNFRYPDDFRSTLLVLDEDTGNVVGTIQSSKPTVDSCGIDIWLFDGKYQTRVNGCDAAVGFLMGVESVLNHRDDLQFQLASKGASAALRDKADIERGSKVVPFQGRRAGQKSSL